MRKGIVVLATFVMGMFLIGCSMETCPGSIKLQYPAYAHARPYPTKKKPNPSMIAVSKLKPVTKKAHR